MCSLSILVAPNTHEVCTGYTAVTKGSKIYLSFMHISITVKEGGGVKWFEKTQRNNDCSQGV